MSGHKVNGAVSIRGQRLIGRTLDDAEARRAPHRGEPTAAAIASGMAEGGAAAEDTHLDSEDFDNRVVDLCIQASVEAGTGGKSCSR